MDDATMRQRGVEILPGGRLRIRVTYLEMRKRPEGSAPRPAGMDLVIMRAVRPTVSFYRYLFNTVGGPWLWVSRRRQSDEEVRAVVQHEAVEVHVLYVDGVPAGYAELDFRQMPDVELLFFGLVPEFIGRGLGPVLLGHAIEVAFGREPERFWLHTCNLDHPKALAVYRRAGFVPYKEEVKVMEDPRAFGLG